MKKVLVGILTATAAHAAHKPIEVCRLTKADSLHCQTVYSGKVKNKITKRASHSTDRWMAVPCKQLKQILPKLSCKRALGEIGLGEPLVE